MEEHKWKNLKDLLCVMVVLIVVTATFFGALADIDGFGLVASAQGYLIAIATPITLGLQCSGYYNYDEPIILYINLHYQIPE